MIEDEKYAETYLDRPIIGSQLITSLVLEDEIGRCQELSGFV